MAQKIKIPKLGLTMTDALLASWLVAAGEHVDVEQLICVIETDKVSFEVPSPEAGLLHPIVEVGQRVEVGEVIGYLAADEAELADLQAQVTAAETGPVKTTSAPKEAINATTESAAPATDSGLKQRQGERIIATPAARKLSREAGIDLEEISGSGPKGRVVLADVEKYAEGDHPKPSGSRCDFESVTRETAQLTAAERVPIRGIRKIIFKNMKLSLDAQAQLTLHTEASAGDLVGLRRMMNARLKEDAPRVSYNAIIVKAIAQALRRYPMLNAVVDGREIKIWEQVHIGVAMDAGYGLVVPKIRNADAKSVSTLASEIQDLAHRAGKKQLLPDELGGGTFTLTNLGAWDIDAFTPISNFPESAILGVGRIVEKPWVQEGRVIVDQRMALSLTFDHRIIDGALAARFLKTIKDKLEDTRLML